MINRRVVIKNSEGMKITGILDFPDNEGPFPIVVILHGFGGNKENAQTWSEILNPLGIGTFRIDFRGTGESEGEYQDKTLSGFVNDAQAALDYVYQLPNVNKDKVAVVGHSMGGTTAILLAANDPRIKTMVVTSPAIKPADSLASLYDPKDFSIVSQRGYAELRKTGEKKRLKYTFFENAKNYNLTYEAQKIPYRFLVIAGEKDDIVFFDDIKNFKDNVKKAVLIQLPNSGHNLEEEWMTAQGKVQEWFSEWLQG